MCWTKLSCLLLVEVQKSWRTITWSSFSVSPSSLTKRRLCFLPNGGLASTIVYSLLQGAGAFEDDAEHAGLLSELFEDVAILVLQDGAIERQQPLPAEVLQHDPQRPRAGIEHLQGRQ